MNNLDKNACKMYENYLQLKNYSSNTIASYVSIVEKFTRWTGVSPTKVSNSHFREFIIASNFKSRSNQNIHISALKIFYTKVLKRKEVIFEFERPRKSKKLPKIIDQSVILNKINAIKNIKHRAILHLAFSTAMRVSEVCSLMISDIDSKRNIIWIRNAKGSKDRFVGLSESTLILLRDYYKRYKPNTFLFNGQKSITYTPSSCNKLSNKYLGMNFHQIRHNSASAMHENGTDIATISKVLGHQSVKTTQIYTHVSLSTIINVQSPC